jgi:hypothetical protein
MDDANVPAGWPLFGQFVAHDITADRSLLLQHPAADHIANFRTPRANLECLYGDGPVGNPFLYDRGDPAKLLIGTNEQGAPGDLPRNAQGIALVGDPRNDVHLFVSQLHLAMLKIHNLLVDRLREDGVPQAELFDAARRATTWHYQWIILNDFLPTLVGQTLMDELLAEGPRYYKPGGPTYIPFEFADAAYRYGHSQIRRTYRLQAGGPKLPLFPDLIGFGPHSAPTRSDSESSAGRVRRPFGTTCSRRRRFAATATVSARSAAASSPRSCSASSSAIPSPIARSNRTGGRPYRPLSQDCSKCPIC